MRPTYPGPVCVTPTFARQANALALRYPSVREMLSALAEQLTLQPAMGTPLAGTLYYELLPLGAKLKAQSLISVWSVRRNTAFLLLLLERSRWEQQSATLLPRLTQAAQRMQLET